MDPHVRNTEVARCVRALASRWPELDGQLCRRLMAETLADDTADAPAASPGPLPPTGHANVTTLRRDGREFAR
jgi:hypothetical protein